MKTTLSENEYLEAGLLQARPTIRQWLRWLAVILLILALGVVGFRSLARDWMQALYLIATCVAVTAVFAAWLRWYWLPKRLRTLFRQHKALADPFELHWNEQGFVHTSANDTHSTPWSHCHRYREGKTVFIVFLSDALSQVIPKSALGDMAGVDAFRQVLARRAGK